MTEGIYTIIYFWDGRIQNNSFSMNCFFFLFEKSFEICRFGGFIWFKIICLLKWNGKLYLIVGLASSLASFGAFV